MPERLGVLALLVVLSSGCAQSARVAWTPQPLSVVMEPNAFRAYELSLQASAALESIDLTPSADLRPLVSVVPETVVRLEADAPRSVRLGILLPPTVRPGRRITGRLVPLTRASQAVRGDGLEIAITVIPPTADGVLDSLRAALEWGSDDAYLAQFAPARIAEQRRTLATFTDTARLALGQTLRTAERTGLTGEVAEYRVTLLLAGQRAESSIVLRRSPDGIWRVIRF